MNEELRDRTHGVTRPAPAVLSVVDVPQSSGKSNGRIFSFKEINRSLVSNRRDDELNLTLQRVDRARHTKMKNQPSKLGALRRDFNAAAQKSSSKVGKPKPELIVKPPSNVRHKGPSPGGGRAPSTAMPNVKAPVLKQSTTQKFNAQAQRAAVPKSKAAFAKSAVGKSTAGKSANQSLSRQFNRAARRGPG